MGVLDDNRSWFDQHKDILQGNIVKPHGRNFVRLLFFKLDENRKEDTAGFFSTLAQEGLITAAGKQKEDRDKWSVTKGNGELFLGLYLTSRCFQYFDKPVPFPDYPFQNHDSVDCMLMLAHDDEGQLYNLVPYFKNWFQEKCGAAWLHSEAGNKLTAIRQLPGEEPQALSLDHFGFADSISEPALLEPDGHSTYDTLASIENYFYSEVETGSFGSCLVYLKLEQDLHGFKRWENQLEQELARLGAGNLAGMAAALMIGRTREGAPVVDLTKKSVAYWNDFHFSEPPGNACPFHAHIRKMNDRTNGSPNDRFKMLRRGIPYGAPDDSFWKQPSEQESPQLEKGLLFLSFQKNIETFDQQLALADLDASGSGVDPLIGRMKENIQDDESRIERFSHSFPSILTSDNNPLKFEGFGGFVQLKNRLDMFAPSLLFFKSLGQEIPEKTV